MKADNDNERSRHYESGYKKPPDATKFRKGVSGNPTGGRKRKVGPTAHLDVLGRLLSETIQVRVGGRLRRMTQEERYWLGVLADANKGDRCCRKLVADYMNERARARAKVPTGQLIDVEGEPHNFSWTEEQAKLYAELEQFNEELKKEKADQDRASEEHERVCAELERAKEELASIRSSLSSTQIHQGRSAQ